MTRKEAKKIVSESIHKALSKQLYVLEFSDGQTEKQKTVCYESLQNVLKRIFSYADLFELHIDHMIEMAEVLVGLYPERENLSDYTYHILKYLELLLQKYTQEKDRQQQALFLFQKRGVQDPDAYLDLKYTVWTYTHGYYYQQAHARQLLYWRLKELLDMKEKGIL